MSKTIKSKPIFEILTQEYKVGQTKSISWINDDCCVAFQKALKDFIDASITNAVNLPESEIRARYIRISTIKEILNLFNSQNIQIKD